MKLRLRSQPTLLSAMADENLFRRWFRNERTWKAWRVVIKAIFGLPLNRLTGEPALFKALTGRIKVPTKQAREAWLVVGRRGGKSFITALIAVYLATFRSYVKYLAPGERATVMILATDRSQARVIMRYVTALIEEVPMLRRLAQYIGRERIDLHNMVSIEIHTGSDRSVRGYTLCAALLDELAFWRDENSANPDVEVIAALRPALATIPGSMLLGISSPYARRGALWTAYQNHFGVDGDPVLVFQGESALLNPTIPQSEIDRAYEEDPVAAAAEWGAQFRSDVEGFIDPAWLDNAVVEKLHEIQPAPGTVYSAYCDPSGGAVDAFTLGIAHNEKGRLILDVLRVRRPPFNPLSVCAEFAAVLKSYGLSRVIGDRYSAQFVVSAFQENGIYYQPSERSTSDVYLEMLPHFAQGNVQLLDNRALLTELRQLERRTGRGKDVISHPPRGHDDAACSACGSLLLAVSCTPIDMKGACAIGGDELREVRDEHLAELGWAGDSDNYSPFNTRDLE